MYISQGTAAELRDVTADSSSNDTGSTGLIFRNVCGRAVVKDIINGSWGDQQRSSGIDRNLVLVELQGQACVAGASIAGGHGDAGYDATMALLATVTARDALTMVLQDPCQPYLLLRPHSTGAFSYNP